MFNGYKNKKSYIQLCKENGYNDIIAIVVKQEQNNSLSIYAQHNDKQIEGLEIHELQ
jgi:hypothetical protein